MQKVVSIVNSIIAAAVLCPFSLPVAGAPRITVDSAHFDVGIIYEGEKSKISHTFIIRNNGDDTLVIEKVRPG